MSKDPQRIIYILLNLLIWIYLWFRALLVPPAHDEIATFFYYISTGDFLPFQAHPDANNHVLNSALSHIALRLFGESILSWRLANLLTMPLFIISLYKIGLLVKSTPIRWLFWLSLMTSHNFLEFFGLSRGYGISMALLLGALWFTLLYFRSTKTAHAYGAMALISLAVLANLSLFNTLLLLSLLLLYHSFRQYRITKHAPDILGKFLILLLLSAGLILFFALLLFEMKGTGQLYYGSDLGLWKVTVKTLVPLLTSSDSTIVYIAVAVIIFTPLLWTLYRFPLSILQKTEFTNSTLVSFLVAGNIIIIILLNKLLNINYPEDRVGLYFVPLIIIAFCFTLDELRSLDRRMWTPSLILLYVPVHFLISINLTYPAFYRNDIIPERFYDKVTNIHKEDDYPPTIGGYRVRHFCWSYLDYINGGKESQIFWSNYPGFETDIQIAEGKDISLFRVLYDSLDYCEINDRYLLKRKKFLPRVPLGSSTYVDFPPGSKDEYYLLGRFKADTLISNDIFVGLDITVESVAEPFLCRVVAEARDSSEKPLRYEYLALEWLRRSWKDESSRLKNGLLLHDLPEGTEHVQVYLWNRETQPFALHGKCGLYRVGEE